jgi:hypothetical protein
MTTKLTASKMMAHLGVDYKGLWEQVKAGKVTVEQAAKGKNKTYVVVEPETELIIAPETPQSDEPVTEVIS